MIKALIITSFASNIPQSIENLEASNTGLPFLASYRFHLRPAASALRELGIHSFFLSPSSDYISTEMSFDYSLIIFSKLTSDASKTKSIYSNVEILFRNSREFGIPTVCLYSNNHLFKSDLSFTYKKLLPKFNLVVATSNLLRYSIKQYARNYVLIEDPILSESLPYRKLPASSECIELAWYGSNSTLKPMLQLLPKLKSLSLGGRKAHLRMLTGRLSLKHEDYLNNLQSSGLSQWKISYENWSISKHYKNLRRSHFVIIPCFEDIYSSSSGHNRLVEAVISGAIPIATPINSYQELSDVSILSKNIPQSLLNSIENYESISCKLASNRSSVIKRFSLETILEKWRINLMNVLQTY